MAGGSTRGSMDHLIGALAFQSAGADPNAVVYIPYDAGGEALAGLLSGEAQILSTGFSEACLLYTSPSPRDATLSRMPSSA